MARVLVVDDDRPVLEYFRSVVAGIGHSPICAPTADAAIKACRAGPPACSFIDLRLGRTNGIALLRELKQHQPTLPAVLMSAYHPTTDEIRELLDTGFMAFLPKPCRADDICRRLLMMLDGKEFDDADGAPTTALTSDDSSDEAERDGMIGRSASMQHVHGLIGKYARVPRPVLITGETGTGKELAARAIHARSARPGQFVAVNCGGVPSTLFEAQCFGHERGAFTDAHERTAGWFEEAHRGTLLLDEVGELPLESQAKLLRVLQERKIRRLGGHTDIPVDVRVIAATHVDLADRVIRGAFRADLYYRLCALRLSLPPLRDRREDWPLLIDHCLARCRVEARMPLAELSAEAREVLGLHSWPGNIRELEHTLIQAVVEADGGVIRPEHLPAGIPGGSQLPGVPEMCLRRPPDVALPDWRRTIDTEVRRLAITEALLRHHGNRTRTALDLGINRKTLFDEMRDLTLTFGDEIK